MADHRCAQGWVHFHSRSRAYLDKRIPLFLRCKRLVETVGRTVAYAAGAWAWHEAALNKANSTIRQMMKLMLNRRPREGQSSGEFHAQLEVKLNWLLDSWNWVPFRAQLLKLQANWMEHVARLSPDSLVRLLAF